MNGKNREWREWPPSAQSPRSRRYRRLAIALSAASAFSAAALPSPAMADVATNTASLVVCASTPGSTYASVTGNPTYSNGQQVLWYYALSWSWDFGGTTYHCMGTSTPDGEWAQWDIYDGSPFNGDGPPLVDIYDANFNDLHQLSGTTEQYPLAFQGTSGWFDNSDSTYYCFVTMLDQPSC